MEGKVLFLQFDFRSTWRAAQDKMTINRLTSEGFQVINFDWGNFNPYCGSESEFELNIKKAVELSKEMGIAYIHFGSQRLSRGDFPGLVKRFKETGVKVIVENESEINLEDADWVYNASNDLDVLVKKIKKFCEEKNRSE